MAIHRARRLRTFCRPHLAKRQYQGRRSTIPLSASNCRSATATIKARASFSKVISGRGQLEIGYGFILFKYPLTMSVPRLLFITMTFLAGRAISHQDHAGTCGPFALTTTSGTLYSAPNGTQLPGSTRTELEEGQYIISDNGTLTTHNGSLCEFRRQYSPVFRGIGYAQAVTKANS